MNQLHLTPIVKNLIIINVLVFIASQVLSSVDWVIFTLSFPTTADFRPFQFITSLFMHADIMHIFMNMFGLAVFGPLLEMVWQGRRFFVYYLICGIGANLLYTLWAWFLWAKMGNTEPHYHLLGASAALYGVLLGGAMVFPNMEIRMLFFPTPIKARYMVFIWIGIELASGIGHVAGDNTAHIAHLCGMLVGFLVLQYWRFFGTTL
ncbi:MAG: hypothetical protein RI894_2473 [Bacteroidota bacterium]